MGTHPVAGDSFQEGPGYLGYGQGHSSHPNERGRGWSRLEEGILEDDLEISSLSIILSAKWSLGGTPELARDQLTIPFCSLYGYFLGRQCHCS